MAPRRRGLKPGIIAVLIAGVAIIGLGVLFFLNTAGGSSTTNNQPGQYPFQVGKPGPGEQAPPITLPSTAGGTFDLAAMHGKTVLLYFQEGLTCQPCWDQLKDIQSNMSQFQALGIDQVVSITTDPLNALQQKVADEGITIPVLSDPSLAVSSAYTANGYGMMGASRDGHTFIVVGPDGLIKWRADYGGAPKYTMYVPVPNLVADMRAGLNGKTS
jgi:peroxiredoxin Q/BCP